jgi:hypothetical protein
MKKLVITFLFALNLGVLFSQNLSPEIQQVVTGFINGMKNQKGNEPGFKIAFPLTRRYPIPPIYNEREFIRRYHEIFDDSLINLIVHSDPQKDWSEMGWRGIMFLNGLVWLEEDGTLRAVTDQSKFERDEWVKLVSLEKKGLYKSINEFKQPICVLETLKYRIRIDDLGNSNYRYVSWPLNSRMSVKPELVLENGEYVPEGTGGNHSYKFKTGDFIYECSIIIMGPDDSPPARLTIYKGNKPILYRDAKIVIK